MRDWQDQQLRTLVEHAYDTVPYYRRLFDRRGLSPKHIEHQEDLGKIPLLTRRDIQENFENLWSRAFKRKRLRLGHTSGTTGSPLEVLYDEGVVKMTYAMMDRQYQWAGVELSRTGDRIAVLRGNVIVPVAQKEPPYWRYNYVHNQLLLSSFHLSTDNLHHYAAELRRFAPAVLDGYPSTLYILARYFSSRGERFPVRAVITSSETLYDFQREMIEKSFECRVFDYYAAAERAIFAAECDHHKGHHICSEYGIAEILDSEGKAMAPGESGVLVGTSLHNFGMPLLRYVGNDVTAFKKTQCSCGRRLPVMDDVATKAEDIIALRDGRMISPSVLTHPFKPMHSVEASQIIQEDYDVILIKIVPCGDFGEAEYDHLVQEFKARLGGSVDVRIELTDTLARTKSGKFKWVISKVDKAIQVP
jgi:phenylacetate-CoA ligase